MALRTASILIQPIRTDFLGLLLASFDLLIFLNGSLYSEGQNIKQTLQNQEQLQAEKENMLILDQTFTEFPNND